jgi:gluconate 2-dehydrogenase gamma chain
VARISKPAKQRISSDIIRDWDRSITSRSTLGVNDTMLRGMVTEPTRRRILELALASHAAAIAEAQQHAHRASKVENPNTKAGTQGKLQSLSAEEAEEVGALTSLIIPSGSTPGAREAGVTYFIDKALATFDRDKREAYRLGLRTVEAHREELFPGSTSIASLNPDDQLRLAEAIENTEFFETLRVHTVMAFLGRPEYGGNRNQSGWTLIGFKE